MLRPRKSDERLAQLICRSALSALAEAMSASTKNFRLQLLSLPLSWCTHGKFAHTMKASEIKAAPASVQHDICVTHSFEKWSEQ